MPISKIKTSSITADAASVNLNIDANTLFLDAANNRVGVNTTSPSEALQVNSSSDSVVRITSTAASGKAYNLTSGGNGNYSPGVFAIRNVTDATTPFAIYQDSIGFGGNTGPDRPVHLKSSGSRNYFKAETTVNSVSYEAGFETKTPTANFLIGSWGNTSALWIYDINATAERLRVDPLGRILIGAYVNNGGGKLDVVSESGSNAVLSARSVNAGTGDGTADVTVTRAVTNGAQWWANARYDAYSHAWGYGGGATAATAMRINGSGHLGIKVNPNGNWPSGWSIIELQGNNNLWSVQGQVQLGYNNYYDGTNYRYGATNYGHRYLQSDNGHMWESAPSGSANALLSFETQMSIDLQKSLALRGATPKSGTGITFPASQFASADPNTLDDYEEGSWTANFYFSNGVSGTTGGNTSARYVKVGKQVTCWFYINCSSINGGTGQAYISGLPFTAASVVGAAEGATMTPNYWSGFTSVIPGGYVQYSNNRVLMINLDATSSTTGLTSAAFGSSTNLYANFTYFTD